MITLFWDETGPLVHYVSGMLHVEDGNPHRTIRWRMTRWKMLRLGCNCIIAALSQRTSPD